ncbi:MAG: hypothetical protein O6930_00880, partial [Gammaproteobacteria bacterium]|nr:hypothetical protein [Gammaproteobacteria bacterium]
VIAASVDLYSLPLYRGYFISHDMHLLVVKETSSPGTKKGHPRKEIALYFGKVATAFISTLRAGGG